MNGPYADDATAAITRLNAGVYKATIAANGAARFYRVPVRDAVSWRVPAVRFTSGVRSFRGRTPFRCAVGEDAERSMRTVRRRGRILRAVTLKFLGMAAGPCAARMTDG